MSTAKPTLSTSVQGSLWSVLASPFWLHLLFEGFTSLLMIVYPAAVPVPQSSPEATRLVRDIGNLLLALNMVVYRTAPLPEQSRSKQLASIGMFVYHLISVVLVATHAAYTADVTTTSVSSLCIHSGITYLLVREQFWRAPAVSSAARTEPPDVKPPWLLMLMLVMHLLVEAPLALHELFLSFDSSPPFSERSHYTRGVGNLRLAVCAMVATTILSRAHRRNASHQLLGVPVLTYHMIASALRLWQQTDTRMIIFHPVMVAMQWLGMMA
jgi:hypothetical protein